MSFDSDAGFVPDSTNLAIFWLLKVGDPDDWVRVWSGFGDYLLPADAIDTTGGTYNGLDFPTAIPDLDLAVNGDASNIDFGISGVSATSIRLLGVDRDAVQGAKVHLGVIDLDDHQQPIGAVDWLREAVAGRPRSSRTQSDGHVTRSIVLPTVTDSFDRNQAALAYWSPTSQRLRSPGDAFFDQVPQMANLMIIEWPQ